MHWHGLKTVIVLETVIVLLWRTQLGCFNVQFQPLSIKFIW